METAINLLLRKFRKKHQLTQVQAAKLLAIPLGSLRDYEQSRYTPNGLVALGTKRYGQ
jgi:DNA-binding transcriptional regulator YiaG